MIAIKCMVGNLFLLWFVICFCSRENRGLYVLYHRTDMEKLFLNGIHNRIEIGGVRSIFLRFSEHKW